MPAKLRAIDKGTVYDVTGRMRSLVRRIESGEIRATDVIIVTHDAEKGYTGITTHHYGPSSVEKSHWMLATALNRIEPA